MSLAGPGGTHLQGDELDRLAPGRLGQLGVLGRGEGEEADDVGARAGMGQRDLDTQHDPDRRPEVNPLGTTAEAALDDQDSVSGASTRTNLVGQPREDVQGPKTLRKNRDIVRGG